MIDFKDQQALGHLAASRPHLAASRPRLSTL